jgi:hypothetical protein
MLRTVRGYINKTPHTQKWNTAASKAIISPHTAAVGEAIGANITNSMKIFAGAALHVITKTSPARALHVITKTSPATIPDDSNLFRITIQ